ncbi:Uncharacterized protein OBRU01_08486 [Operophtera brumata]|uniref:Oxidoreductase-like domain-containing protein n=1 Tax=Operophtera brumata TaxID=104452 RepID=A0A0L7LGW0_OPEBR|nr:Uncharacterized protein OBRU01_08486 [Operophtera brumata]
MYLLVHKQVHQIVNQLQVHRIVIYLQVHYIVHRIVIYLQAHKQKSRIFPLQTIARQSYNIQSKLCSTTDTTNDEKEKELERIAKEATIDEPPIACCRSGCANCVYIAWAEAITAKMKDAGPDVCEKILKMYNGITYSTVSLVLLKN